MGNASWGTAANNCNKGDMLMIYSYIIPRDYGFAPNPFYGVCTLATCKPLIRKNAQIGDWIVGFGRKNSENYKKIIFAMQVESKMSFNEYWSAPEFQCKKPIMNGSLKQNYGDNIYHQEDGKWVQSDSHHSDEGGKPNMLNLKRDTSSDNVLLGTNFWYFGKDAVECPAIIKKIIVTNRGHKVTDDEDIAVELSNWLNAYEEKGFIGEPDKFKEGFQRYDGK